MQKIKRNNEAANKQQNIKNRKKGTIDKQKTKQH